jgi:hypothetical protein
MLNDLAKYWCGPKNPLYTSVRKESMSRINQIFYWKYFCFGMKIATIYKLDKLDIIHKGYIQTYKHCLGWVGEYHF